MTNGHRPNQPMGKPDHLMLAAMQNAQVEAEQKQRIQRIDQFISDTAGRIYAGLVVAHCQEMIAAVEEDVGTEILTKFANVAKDAAPYLAASVGMITLQPEKSDG